MSDERQRQRTHWQRVARDLPDLYPAPTTGYYRRCEIELIRRAFGSLRGKRLLKLDLWNEAKNTRILHWIEEQGADAYGLDLSHLTATIARRNSRMTHPRIRILQADIRELPFPDRSFDLLYTMGTIEHIAEYRQAVREVRRVLRPGGRAILGVPYKWNLFLRPALVAVLDALGLYPYSPEKSFGTRELTQVVEEAGLRVRERRGILTIPGVLRMADLYLYSRGIPLYRLTGPLVAPFEFFETRWTWVGRLGYLLALVVEAPEVIGTARARL